MGGPPGRTNGKEDRSNSPVDLHRKDAEEAEEATQPRPLLCGIKGKKGFPPRLVVTLLLSVVTYR